MDSNYKLMFPAKITHLKFFFVHELDNVCYIVLALQYFSCSINSHFQNIIKISHLFNNWLDTKISYNPDIKICKPILFIISSSNFSIELPKF